MAGRNNFFNGIAELLILSILNNGDSYIYEIKKLLNEKSNGVFDISQNTIYAAAYKLENENKISEYQKLVGKKRIRIYYHIEKSGKEYLESLMNEYLFITNNVNLILDNLSKKEDSNNEESN